MLYTQLLINLLNFSSQTHDDLPVQFFKSSHPIEANLVIASFGSAKGYDSLAFRLSPGTDSDEPASKADTVRYGKLEEIKHTFKEDPQSPPMVISLVFVVAVLATLPALSGVVSTHIFRRE